MKIKIEITPEERNKFLKAIEAFTADSICRCFDCSDITDCDDCPFDKIRTIALKAETDIYEEVRSSFTIQALLKHEGA